MEKNKGIDEWGVTLYKEVNESSQRRCNLDRDLMDKKEQARSG